MKMTKEEYNEYCKEWDEYFKLKDEYIKKKLEILRNDKIDDETKNVLVDILKEEYGWDALNPKQFGPFTKIFSREELEDSEFILPGLDKCYMKLKNTDKDLPKHLGDMVKDYFGEIHKVMGFGYDATDYYILTEKENGEKGSIIMNSHYQYITK